ncbi:hypothetical protein [Streptomyces sp. NK15101]|uniref:hypothetical protein n=1 Tax=Streptomyces sp. NK15101 TaxID=2873261 RepID=UPI001CEC2988|nr:hypothetical protein [Streptomyces sp. NK15101]
MTTTPAPAPHASAPAPRRRGRVVALVAGGAAPVLLLAALAQGCGSSAGGAVLSETAYREHLRHTREAGENAVRSLGVDPDSVIKRRETANASCKDDLGVDPDGVTRDRPTVDWTPGFASGAAYTAAVDTLRKEWSARGLTVEDLPAPAGGEPGAGLPGVRTKDDRGIELSLRPDRYDGEPTLTADGGCVRHQGYLTDW